MRSNGKSRCNFPLGRQLAVLWTCKESADLATRKVESLGVRPQSNDPRREQIARNLTGENSFLVGKKYLIHDRDPPSTDKFESILKTTMETMKVSLLDLQCTLPQGRNPICLSALLIGSVIGSNSLLFLSNS